MFFLIITVLIFNLITLLIPKRLSRIEMVTTTLFAMYLQNMTDVFLNVKYDLYGYFQKGVEFQGLLYIFGIYPAINIVYLNYFPHKKPVSSKITYITCWVIFSVIYEKLLLLSGTYYYNGWKLSYSLMIYPFLFIILVLFKNFTRSLVPHGK